MNNTQDTANLGNIGDKKYTCPICGAVSLNYSELAEHTARHADNEDARRQKEAAEKKRLNDATLDKQISEMTEKLKSLISQRYGVDANTSTYRVVPPSVTGLYPSSLARLLFGYGL